MQIIKSLGLATVIVLSGSLFIFPQQVKADELDRLALTLCEAAQSDDRRIMRKKLESARIRLRAIYKGIRCGNKGSLLRTATQSGSLNSAKYIATKISKSDLASAEEDGLTIIQFAEKLVANGDAGKQAFVDLYKSKS